MLARQSRAGVGLIDLATVAQGAEAVGARLDALAREGKGAAIADAVLDRDLAVLGAAALTRKVSTGASGLGLGLARALVAAAASHPPAAADLGPAIGGPAACLAGSCSQATLGQIARAEAAMPVRRLDPARLLAGEDEAGAALAWALERVGDGPVLIASSAGPEDVAAVQARYGRDAAGHRTPRAAMARIAEGLVAHGVRRLVVAGGETSGAVVDRLGLPAFARGPRSPRRAGLRTTDRDMWLALKSGNFGGPDFFADALRLMP